METYLKLNNQLNIPENGSIPLNKDREAVKAYFKEHVNKKTYFAHDLEERIAVLVDGGYIEEDFLDAYEFSYIKELFKYVYSKKYRFQSFAGAYKFYTQYAMKTDDGKTYLERYEDRVVYNALMMGNGDEKLAKRIATDMILNIYQPATPTFMNAGRKRRGEYVSCFLIQVEDDLPSIGRASNSVMYLSSMGGGVGINLSNVRALGDPIKGVENASGGVVPIMKIFEEELRYANQLGQRKGAGAVYLNIFHAEVFRFLSTKKENAESAMQVKTLSLGLTVPDKYYELVEKDEVMHLFSPYDVSKVYGVPFSFVDITAEYDNMVANPAIRSTVIRAKDLDVEIGKLQQESGYPYIINVDTANRANPIYGKIIMSNLCSEILQVQTPSDINIRQEYEHVGTDISCNLGSMNIPNLLEKSEDIEASFDTAVRALTAITDASNLEGVPSIANGNKLAHTIGLGAMGLHTLLATNKIHYGSKASLEFTNIFFMMMNYYTLKSSNRIAHERQEDFYNFEKSKYATGEYFDMYLDPAKKDEYVPVDPRVAKIFEGHHIPTQEDWEQLKKDIMETGLYHQNRLAVAPNGSISYINETSASLHPITTVVEERQEKKLGKFYYPAPRLSTETLPYYKSAYDIPPTHVIDVYAEAQKHIDQGMSLTLFTRSVAGENIYPWKPEGGKTTTRDLTNLRHYAWRRGIKSIYYVRTFTEDENEIGVSNCESCTI